MLEAEKKNGGDSASDRDLFLAEIVLLGESIDDLTMFFMLVIDVSLCPGKHAHPEAASRQG